MKTFVTMHRRGRWAGAGLGLFLLVGSSLAQFPQLGLHYYIIENLDLGTIVQRGTTGANGVAHDRVILPPNTRFRETILQAKTMKIGVVEYTSPDNGRRFRIPKIFIGPSTSLDGDGDGLHDLGEFVMGTNAGNPDSDGDDIPDGAEVTQGLNPLDGLPAATGLIASQDTPGSAVDIDALNDFAAVADSGSGVTVFNVFNGMNPVRVAQVDTPGIATAVACDGMNIAVADGMSGLAVINIEDPPAAFIAHQVSLGGSAKCVDAAAGVGYVGLSNGRVVSVSLRSGTILNHVSLGAPVQDVMLGGNYLYALTAGRMYVLSMNNGALASVASVATSSGGGSRSQRLRLFIGDKVAYAVQNRGYNTINISDPTNPRIIKETVSPQFGWKHIVVNGSGLGVAAVSPNLALDGAHHVSLYDTRDPVFTQRFITTFGTPGVAAAVSIFNGIAYAADSRAGLQVINYLAYDALGQPPIVTLGADFSLDPGLAEEAKLVRVTARVQDDVQVRNVELLIDGQKVATDGNFPFEFRFVTPLISEQSSFTVQARASDTGGNANTTPEYTIVLRPDATPPAVVGSAPSDGLRLGGAENISIFFTEAIDEATLTPANFSLVNAVDGIFGNGNDQVVTGGSYELVADGRQAVLSFPASLPFGDYRVSLTGGITDLAGNALPALSFDFSLSALTIEALSGTATDRFQPNANPLQTITVEGTGFLDGQVVTFPARNANGGDFTRDVLLTDIAPDGSFGTVVVPLDAHTGELLLPDGTMLFLQVVPTVTSISGGGPGDFVSFRGTGFIEGDMTIRFGDASVVDGGPASNDGINVYGWNSTTVGADATVPLDGLLPYQIITEGGSSGTSNDVTAVVSTSITGTPAVPGEASANVSQQVTVIGNNFTTSAPPTLVVMEGIDENGSPFIISITPDTVASNGTSLVFTVPKDGRTGPASILNGADAFLLQVVPRLNGYIRGGRGRSTTLEGTAFTEGNIRIVAGPATVVDQGRGSADGINSYSWFGDTDRLDFTAPLDAMNAYEVITEGGSSGRTNAVLAIPTVAETGTPADPNEASANVSQQVTILGNGFTTNVPATSVIMDGIDQNGTTLLYNIAPDFVAPDGSSLTFTVPKLARTGLCSVNHGSEGILLQIVPRMNLVVRGGRGRFSTIEGTGLTEGFISVRFDNTQVVDGGPASNDGIDSYDWFGDTLRIDLTIPLHAQWPWEIVTEGGSSGQTNDVLQIPSVALTGTPANSAEASANVSQQVTILGNNFRTNNPATTVILDAIDGNGTPYVLHVTPDSVAPDGRSLTFTVPRAARTGRCSVSNGGASQILQIVPRVTFFVRGGKGRFSTIEGTGFTEGFVSFRGGNALVVDRGVASNDGIDVYDWFGDTVRMDVTVPLHAELPYEIITEGGNSGRTNDVLNIPTVALTGTPADPAEGSTLVGQVVTLIGNHFRTNAPATQVVMESIDGNGTPYIVTVSPDTITPDGTQLTFTVPKEARTGRASVLSGGSGRLLQVVPSVHDIVAGGQGRFSTLEGRGLTEGFITVRSAGASVIDGNPGSGAGINSYDWFGNTLRIDLTLPGFMQQPYEIVTEGGTSGQAGDVTAITGVAAVGTPHDSGEASANTGQQITLTGAGYASNRTVVVFEAVDGNGTRYVLEVIPDAIATDGTSLQVTVPDGARTGLVGVIGGREGRYLQIVPTVIGLPGGGPGAASTIEGTSFIEGIVAVEFSNGVLEDGGTASNDGINVYNWFGENRRMDLTIPVGATGTFTVVSEGGRSNAFGF